MASSARADNEFTGRGARIAPSPSPHALPLEALAPYMRGVQMAMTGMAERMRDPVDRAEVSRTAVMAEQFLKAQAATRRVVGSG